MCFTFKKNNKQTKKPVKVTGNSFAIFINLTSLTQGDEENGTG